MMTETLWRLHDVICQSEMTVKDALTLCHENGLISDHVVFLGHVADADAIKCIEFLRKNQNHERFLPSP